jgi:hypothetical protein
MACSQDEEVQKRGVVFIAYLVGSFSALQCDRSVIKQVTKLDAAVPLRVASLHRCYSDPLMSPLLNFAAFRYDTSTRTRFRTHKGKELIKAPLPVDMHP